MRPERGGGRGHEIRDAGAILRNAYTVLARHAGVAVGHVPATLLVRHRDEANAGERKQVERVHVSRADDAENVFHAIGDQRFDERLRRRHLLLAGNGEMPGIRHRIHVIPSTHIARDRLATRTAIRFNACMSIAQLQ